MEEIRLQIENHSSITLISNVFIEKYMTAANGAFVKLYLYLLYLVQKNRGFSLASTCDFLDDTEKDVMRGLHYWEKVGLLSMKLEGQKLLSLSLLNPTEAYETSETAEIAHFVVTNMAESDKTKEMVTSCLFTGDSKTDAQNDDDLKLIMNVAEKYMERFLTSADIHLICDLYEKMSFSSELILYLFEYCAGLGKTDTKYVEKVALKWADEGIRSVEEAIEHSNQYNQNFNAVMKAFGLARALGKAEMEMINKWVHSFQMPIDLIIEACNRSLLNTTRPDFKYADSCLKNWHEKGCHSFEDIQKNDTAFLTAKDKKLSGSNERRNRPVRNLSSFPQREYSEEFLDDIEKKLLNNK